MSRVTFWRLSAALALALPALAGCGTFGGEEEQLTGCPAVTILEGAETLTRFEPAAGRDLSDVQLEVRVDQAAPVACQAGGGEAEVDMQVRFSLVRGPASAGGQTSFGYFVAISDPDSRIVAREGFNLAVDFPENRTQAAAVDDLVTTIPLTAGDRLGDYRIMVGLQLTPEELDYNRRMRVR